MKNVLHYWAHKSFKTTIVCSQQLLFFVIVVDVFQHHSFGNSLQRCGVQHFHATAAAAPAGILVPACWHIKYAPKCLCVCMCVRAHAYRAILWVNKYNMCKCEVCILLYYYTHIYAYSL